ncbi:MAG: hypothetical protein RLZZ337_941 [Bacteroidota bacterium]|jgi:flagellar motor protein MotB
MNEVLNKYWLVIFSLVLLTACGSRQQANGQSGIPKKAQAMFDKAITHYQYGEFEEAEEIFNSLIKKYPSFGDAYDGLAKTYQDQGKIKPAIGLYRQLLDLQPGHYFALYELGNIYFKQEQMDSAKYFFHFFLKENAGNDDNTQNVRTRLDNIAFAEESMKNPRDITPVNLGPNINTNLEEYSPAFSIDENTIYLTQRNGTLHPSQQNEDIYYAQRNGDHWSAIRSIGTPINTIENEGAFSISADGNYIFFTSCSRPGGVGQCDIWLTMNKEGIWTDPANLQKPINTKYWESQPSISSNGKLLYFTSDRPGGFGGTDLWVASFGEKGWEEPVNLGPEINTAKDEQFPFIHSDGTTLYFSSEGHRGMGKSDLFISHLKPDGTWEKPRNLGYPINTIGEDWNLVVGRDGETAYYSTDKLPNTQGGMDIYSFKLPKDIQAQKVNYAKGYVRDAITKKPLSASVLLTPIDNSKPTYTLAAEKTGIFTVALIGNMQYALTIDKPGYLFHSEYFDMPNVSTDEPFALYIDLQKVEVGNSIILKNIFFDTDKYDLKPASSTELEKLYTFLINNGSTKIEISGHTDNVGVSVHNLKLSENRAKSVYNYLVTKGIDSNRLSYKGYGDTKPIADNASAEGRSKNRRTEFKVVN